jgi:N-acetylneuraminate synthase
MKSVFNNLFVLELANNHWGSLDRGKEIVKSFAKVVKNNNVKASIKLQFRDVDNFIHKDWVDKDTDKSLLDLPKIDRYIQKTLRTKLTADEYAELVSYIKKSNCITMATPFDETSVDLCTKLNIEIIKIASSDLNDWLLLRKIAQTKKPVIFSTGGANDKQIDDAVKFFQNRNIEIALNHCVSKYPSENYELELNQIDYLKERYPDIVVGFSTHEYQDWKSSMLISYAKGARTWERHIDIPYPDGHEQKFVSPYCSTPEQVDDWFKAFTEAQVMCGNSKNARRLIDNKESDYLKALYRGLWLNKDMKKGDCITLDDVYSAVPYLKEKNHITSRNFFENTFILKNDLKKDQPLTSDDII